MFYLFRKLLSRNFWRHVQQKLSRTINQCSVNLAAFDSDDRMKIKHMSLKSNICSVFYDSTKIQYFTAIRLLFVKHPWMVATNGKPCQLVDFSWTKPEFVER